MGVKNKTGGNKAKKQGRKHVVVPTVRRVRFSEDDGEIYACCEKMLGGGMIVVKCIDDKQRLCVIRKKFRGRHKSDNRLAIGTWILVGIREFETAKKDKQEKCDLLEVYKDSEQDQLKQHSPSKPWNLFSKIGNTVENEHEDEFENNIIFKHTINDIEMNGETCDDTSINNNESGKEDTDDEIDIDDI